MKKKKDSYMYTSYMILITKKNVRDMDIGTILAAKAKRTCFWAYFVFLPLICLRYINTKM